MYNVAPLQRTNSLHTTLGESQELQKLYNLLRGESEDLHTPTNNSYTEYMDYIDVTELDINRGDIFDIDLGLGWEGEQSGERPCIVIQNDIGNRFSPTIIVAAITSQLKSLPTHFTIENNFEELGLDKPSQILFEQIRTVSKKRIKNPKKIGHIDLELVKEPLFKSFGFVV